MSLISVNDYFSNSNLSEFSFLCPVKLLMILNSVKEKNYQIFVKDSQADFIQGGLLKWGFVEKERG